MESGVDKYLSDHRDLCGKPCILGDLCVSSDVTCFLNLQMLLLGHILDSLR
jgi:hypothetical protein